MAARNDAELRRAIMPALKAAAKYVVNEILKGNENLIQQIVYDAYDPVEYKRTGQFKKAWETESNTTGNKAQAEFKYAPEKMTESAPHHASVVDGQPAADYLADIIYNGLSGAIYQEGYAKNFAPFEDDAWAKKRDVWTALNKEFGTARIKQLFEEGMRQQGLNFRRHNVAIRVTKEK